ncbi:hypothetical protein [Dactylosporangium sp. NPDC049140]|uniref:hypothetical protein n=1 Tax=Dactylosporangium sp. NPDC049140 TaxID=3155647 RepID=UPI0033E21FFB
MTTVLGVGLDQQVPAVGKRGVVAPHGEQFALFVHCGFVQVGDATDDEPGGDLVAGALERGVGGFGDVRAGDEPLLLVVPDRLRIADFGPGVLADGGDRRTDRGVDSDRDREPHPGSRGHHRIQPATLTSIPSVDQG